MQATTPTSIPSFIQVAGLSVCVVSGIATLATHWGVLVAAPPAALFPSRELIAVMGSLPEPVLQNIQYGWFGFCALGTVAFAWLFHWITAPRRHSRRMLTAAFIAQTAIGVVLNPDFLVLTSIELPFVFAFRRALAWLIGQELIFLIFSVVTISMQASDLTIDAQHQAIHFSSFGIALILLVDRLAIVGWHIFAFAAGHLAASEQSRRTELAAANSELLATQQLLDQTARSSERLRIARDLHDAIGHNLTALGLHLDIAGRGFDDKGVRAVQTAREIVQRLLDEVRAIVGIARRLTPVDLQGALGTLCEGLPEPQVTLHYDDAIVLPDVEPALIVFRMVQEALSNVLKHAAARKVTVQVTHQGGDALVFVQDDGRGADTVRAGNGLTGLRERLRDVGGTLDWTSRQGGGFLLKARIPLGGCTS